MEEFDYSHTLCIPTFPERFANFAEIRRMAMNRLKAFYKKYKQYIRIDARMYLVMVVAIVIAVIVISNMRKS